MDIEDNVRDKMEELGAGPGGGDRGSPSGPVARAEAPLAERIPGIDNVEHDCRARFALLELDLDGPPAGNPVPIPVPPPPTAVPSSSDPLTPAATTAKLTDHGFRCGRHASIVIDYEMRLVRCRICNADLDPLTVLNDFANHERQFCYMNADLRQQVIDLGREVEGLKRIRSNLKAQIQNAKKQGTLFQG